MTSKMKAFGIFNYRLKKPLTETTLLGMSLFLYTLFPLQIDQNINRKLFWKALSLLLHIILTENFNFVKY